VRKDMDRPVDIPAIQAYIIAKAAELDVRPEWPPVTPVDGERKRVAVVGGGPSGLSAAAYLSRQGYAVDVFERAHKAGGLPLIPAVASLSLSFSVFTFCLLLFASFFLDRLHANHSQIAVAA
jgi:cation diffusion facilitator CzcD-associated flavoprotein CzcO